MNDDAHQTAEMGNMGYPVHDNWPPTKPHPHIGASLRWIVPKFFPPGHSQRIAGYYWVTFSSTNTTFSYIKKSRASPINSTIKHQKALISTGK